MRYDLDREELVIDNYPILLADKIVPFLEPGRVEDILAGHLVRPCSKRGPYRKRTPAVQVPANERVPTTRLSPDISIEPETTDKAVRDHSHLLRESASPDPLAGPLKENIPPASIQSNRGSLPTSPGSFSRIRKDVGHTRTPAKDESASPQLAPSAVASTSSVPLISTTHAERPRTTPSQPAVASVRKRGRGGPGSRGGRGAYRKLRAQSHKQHQKNSQSEPQSAPEAHIQSGSERQNPQPFLPPTRRARAPPKLISFNPIPRSIESSQPKPTLVLRHHIDADKLRDVFIWCLKCLEAKRLVDLTEALQLRYHNISRIRELKEVAILLKVDTLRRTCDKLLDGWAGEEVVKEEYRLVESVDAQKQTLFESDDSDSRAGKYPTPESQADGSEYTSRKRKRKSPQQKENVRVLAVRSRSSSLSEDSEIDIT